MKYTFRYLVERDADFAIISAFEKNPKVRRLFLRNFRSLSSKIVEVRHSYKQPEPGYTSGESDIIFIMEDANGKFAIFIEDKINAQAQPHQSERYDVRAKQLVDKHEFEDYRVFLCAPNYYINNESSENVKGYKYKISYEAIVGLLPECLEKSILRNAASKKGCSVVDMGVTQFWSNMRVFVNTNYKDKLVMKGKDEDKPSGSWWQDFETGIEGCTIIMKVDSHKIDLEFKQMGERLDELNNLFNSLGILCPATRTNNGRSKSASIQITIPEDNGLNFWIPFDEQIENAKMWLDEIVKLMNIVEILKKNGIKKFPI